MPKTHSPLPWTLSLSSNREDEPAVFSRRHCILTAWINDISPESALANAKLAIRAVNSHAALVAALSSLTERYLSLANSGDCGFWDPEEVVAARAALKMAGEE